MFKIERFRHAVELTCRSALVVIQLNRIFATEPIMPSPKDTSPGNDRDKAGLIADTSLKAPIGPPVSPEITPEPTSDPEIDVPENLEEKVGHIANLELLWQYEEGETPETQRMVLYQEINDEGVRRLRIGFEFTRPLAAVRFDIIKPSGAVAHPTEYPGFDRMGENREQDVQIWDTIPITDDFFDEDGIYVIEVVGRYGTGNDHGWDRAPHQEVDAAEAQTDPDPTFRLFVSVIEDDNGTKVLRYLWSETSREPRLSIAFSN